MEVYPDDLPTAMQTNDTWIDAFGNLGHNCSEPISRYKDANPDGRKKPHYHILYRRVVINKFGELATVKNDGARVAAPEV